MYTGQDDLTTNTTSGLLTVLPEEAAHTALVADLEVYMHCERFDYTTRPYSAEDVARLSGTFLPRVQYTGALQATKLYSLLRHDYFPSGRFSHTFGALGNVCSACLPRIIALCSL